MLCVIEPWLRLGVCTGLRISELLSIKVGQFGREAIARNIGDGHRLVLGVAGSGKTVILLSRAKLICRLNPAARVLVLCFNVP